MLTELDVKKLVEFDNLKQMNENKYQKLFQLFNDEESKNFLEEQAIRFSSLAAAGIFLWVKGQMSLYLVNKDLSPKRHALDLAN